MKKYPTKFDGYYITEDGKVLSEWNVKYLKGKSGCISVKGELKELNQFPRGGSDENDRYLSVNISLKSENGRTIRQIQYYVHRLVAETLIENPNNYKEIDHIDRNKKNNSISNLKWTNRKENMSWERTEEYKKKVSESVKNYYNNF